MKHCEACASQEGRFANICIFAACECHLLAKSNDMKDFPQGFDDIEPEKTPAHQR